MINKPDFKIIIEHTIDKQIRYLEFKGFNLKLLFDQHPDIKRLYLSKKPYIIYDDQCNDLELYLGSAKYINVYGHILNLFKGKIVACIKHDIIIKQIKESKQRLFKIINLLNNFKSQREIINC